MLLTIIGWLKVVFKKIRIENHRYIRLIRVLNLKKGARNSVPNLSHPNLWPWILPRCHSHLLHWDWLLTNMSKFMRANTLWMPLHCRFGEWKLEVGKIVRDPTEIHDRRGVLKWAVYLLAPSGALIAIPTYYWPSTNPTFSDHTAPQHWTFTFWATTAI